MVNVTKRNKNSKDYRVAYKELTIFISKLKKNNAHYLISHLLTESEQIMIVKRYAAVVMFSKRHSCYRVARTLDLSISTTQRLKEDYNQGVYTKLFTCLSEKDKNRFLLLLEDLIAAQVDPRARARLIRGGR